MRGIIFYATESSPEYHSGKDFMVELNCAVNYAQKTNLPISLLTDSSTTVDESKFDKVLRVDLDDISGFGRKSFVYDKTPYNSTLLLDTDALVMDSDLEFAFNMCEKHHIALSMDVYYSIDRCDFAKNTLDNLGPHKDLIQYNGGVMFFSKSETNDRLFYRWKKLIREKRYYYPQVVLSWLLQDEQINPFVLPSIWNYCAHCEEAYAHGEVKIWHSRKLSPNEETAVFYSRRSKKRNVLFV